MADPEEQLSTRDYLAIALVSSTIMLYQIALTRVLSVVVWYHFAFLTISLVMLGLGAPGVWFALVKRPLRMLPGFLLASGITVPLSVALIVKFGALWIDSSVGYIILSVLPATLSLGGVVCLLLIKATGPSIGRMYGIDLLGAGLGAVVVIPIMHVVPTPLFCAATGILPLIALALYGGRLRPMAVGLSVLIGVSLFVGTPYKITRSKKYDESTTPPLVEDWSPIARLTVFGEDFFYLEKHEGGFSWGRGSKYPADRKVRQHWLEQDGSAGTAITAFDGDLSKVDHLLYDVTTVGYQLRPPERAAVIGGGGGRDILSALLGGATDIDAVELNSHPIDLVSNHCGGLSGDIYHAPGVNAIASEGRSYLTHTDRKFDQIQISLIDSWAASTAGAFALAENNLYTIEAFQLYASRLRERGMLSTSRWMNEIPRLIVLAHRSLETLDVADPKKHIVIVSAQRIGTLLMSETPFDESEIARLDEICEERGFTRLYPPTATPDAHSKFVSNALENGLQPMADLGLNVQPPVDDSPYFFHLLSPFGNQKKEGLDALQGAGLKVNMQSSVVLRQAMYAVVLLALGLFFLPFIARVKRDQRTEPFSHLARASLYFATIGFAFMLIENMLVQRFVLYLGHPSYATTVILTSLLLGMGGGATCAHRLGTAGLRKYGLLVPLLLAALVYGLPGLFIATLGFDLPVRATIGTLVLTPVGAALGLFFPLGMERFGDNAKPWYWAINGVFGVVASVLSLALSMEFGYAFVGLVAVGGYVLAWACLFGKNRTAVV